MKSRFSDQKTKIAAICFVLCAVIFFSERKVERIGDSLQIALPTLGYACSIANGQALEYAARFVIMEVVLHGLKFGLGETQLNARPSGGDKGFPSGHTTAAFFGASSLVTDCIEKNVYVKGFVMLSAAFVGGSRIEANKHTTIQVIAGIFWGWVSQMAFRNRGGITGRLRRRYRSYFVDRKRSKLEEL